VLWISIGIAILLTLPLVLVILLLGLYCYLRLTYVPFIERIFQEIPYFNVPRGQPLAGAEPVAFTTADGLTLAGCYYRSHRPRRGVILFGLEFGSNRWSCLAYCDHLLEAGYDVFTYEPRNQGDSDGEPALEPLQWVSDRDLRDAQAALTYLKSRPDADQRGIGLFGISKGAGAGIVAAAQDPYVRCAVTDGMYSSCITVIPYMRHWIRIYNKNYTVQELLPTWFYGLFAKLGIRRVGQQRGVEFLHVEQALHRFGRPLLMLHGQMDGYIRPEMAMKLYEYAKPPKEFWLIPEANHNKGLEVAGEEYRRRVREFFDLHLAGQLMHVSQSAA
jgi:dipeptidyl aminopeptidase/acylaminoacyl peptidase